MVCCIPSFRRFLGADATPSPTPFFLKNLFKDLETDSHETGSYGPPKPSYGLPEPSYGLAPAYDPAPAYHGGNNNSDNYSLLNLSLKTTFLSAFRSGPIAVAKPKSNMRSMTGESDTESLQTLLGSTALKTLNNLINLHNKELRINVGKLNIVSMIFDIDYCVILRNYSFETIFRLFSNIDSFLNIFL